MSNKLVVGFATVGLAVTAMVAPAAAAKDGPNNSQVCRDIVASPEAPVSPPVFGGCVSTFASVGNLFDPDFPSTSLAIANCKDLEATAFLDPGEPNAGGPYPYQFYWFLGSDPEVFTANNRADCLRLLEAFHTGALTPPG
jgi:hypothetical protein